jgi:DNA-binding NtrC family response regulator
MTALLRRVAEKILQESGYNVISATTGERTLEVYKEGKVSIDLVILDLIMPCMGGNRCLRKLFEIDPRVRVVIVSGYAALGEAEGALEAGAKAIISKPYNARHMLRVIREVLGLRDKIDPLVKAITLGKWIMIEGDDQSTLYFDMNSELGKFNRTGSPTLPSSPRA